VNILLLAAEMAPYVKVGGLGDVAGALPQALRRLGHDVRVVLPRHRRIDPSRWELTPCGAPLRFAVGWETIEAPILERSSDGVPTYFVDIPWLFGDREAVYGAGDDARRFVLFCAAALAHVERLRWRPDVVHCNDWHTAVVPAMLMGGTAGRFFRDVASLLTLHTVAHQGWTDREHLGGGQALLPSFVREHWVNLLALGIGTADLIAAVSPNFAREIQTDLGGHGLDGLLRWRSDRLFGVLNGIDTRACDPAADPALPARYSAEELSGKALCKAALQREAGLPVQPGAPLLGMVSRLVNQKGFDLVAAALEGLVRQTRLQLVILGTGQPEYHALLEGMAGRFPDRVRAWLSFDPALAHRIYAGADMFLMPSLFEPCGLGQLIAMRYGAVPIVRAVGGLLDTVEEGPPGEPRTGFVFWEYDAHKLTEAVLRAVAAYQGPDWERLVRNGMSRDFSWARSAREYARLYVRAMANRLG